MRVTGGRPIQGASVGILMLASRFPRIPGDMGNAATWPFPALYRVVSDASPGRVVRDRAEGLLPAFIEAGQQLQADGVDGITTSCGFLSLFQSDLRAALDVPVLASSLMQVAQIDRMLPRGRRCGVLTVSASALTAEHLRGAGAPEDTPIGSTESGTEFTRVFLNDEPTLDTQAAEADNIAAARDLLDRHPEVGAIVLECTNMTPYAAAIRAATGVPVYAMPGFVGWFQSGLRPRRWPLHEGPA